MTTRRWFYLIPATGNPASAGPCHRAAQSRPPARRQDRLRRTAAAGRWTRHGCYPASVAWPWSIRRRARFRTSRASTPGRLRPSAPVASRSSRPAISSSSSRRRGVDEQLASHRLGVRRPVPHQGPRVRDRGAGARRWPAPDGVRVAAGHGALVRGGGAGQRFGAGGRHRRQRRQPALPADRSRSHNRSSWTTCCCSISGASARNRARCSPISPGWA